MAPKAAGREVDALFDLPLGEFTAARNDLAKRLRKGGSKAEAAKVQAIGKPTASAWAINQLVRTKPKRFHALLESGRAARAAQHRALAGEGMTPLRDAIADQRALVGELRDAAVDLLASDGSQPGDAIVARIETNLQAIVADPRPDAAVLEGRLTADLDPPGLEVLTAPAGPAPKAARPNARAVPESRAARDEPEDEREAHPSRKRSSRAQATGARAAERAEREERAKRAKERSEREREERETKARETKAREAEERAAQRARAQMRQRRLVDSAREDLAEAKAAHERLESDARRREKAAAEAARKADAARKDAVRARERADEGSEAVAAAEARLEEARAALEGIGRS